MGVGSVTLEDSTLRFFWGPIDACALARAPNEMLFRESWKSSSGGSESEASS